MTGYMKPEMGNIDGILEQITLMYAKPIPLFEATPSSGVAVLAENLCVYGCKQVLCHSKVNISS